MPGQARETLARHPDETCDCIIYIRGRKAIVSLSAVRSVTFQCGYVYLEKEIPLLFLTVALENHLYCICNKKCLRS